MGFFDDPTTMGMLGMAGGFAQAGQASRMPGGGIGSALALGGQGLMQGMQAGQAGQLQAQQVQAGQMNLQMQRAMLPMQQQALARMTGGSAPGSFAGPPPQQPGLLSKIGTGLENAGNWASNQVGGGNLFNTTPAASSSSQGGGQGGTVTTPQPAAQPSTDPATQALQQMGATRDYDMFVMKDGRSASQMDARIQASLAAGAVVGGDGKVYQIPGAQQAAFGMKQADAAGTGAGGLASKEQEAAYNNQLALGLQAQGGAITRANQQNQGNIDLQNAGPIATAKAGAEAPYKPVSVPTIGPNGTTVDSTMSAANFAAGQGATNGGAMPAAAFVQKINAAENGGGAPGATNPASTGTGNGQFLSSTWLPTFRSTFPQLASLSDQQALGMRAVPAISDAMTTAYAGQNAAQLGKAGIAPTADALGLAHHFGAGGATSIINAPANTPIANVVGPDVMSANPDLAGQTTSSVRTHAQLTFGTAPVQFGAAPAPMYQGGKPQMTPEQNAMSEGRGADAAAIEKEAAGAPQQMAMIDNIRQAAQGFRTGASGDARLAAGKTLTDGLQTLGFTAPSWLVDGTANGEAINKLGGYLAAQQTRVLGSREAASVFNQIRSINPGITSSPAGLDILLNSKQQDLQRQMDLRDFQQQYVADPSNKGTTVGMQQAFEKQYPIQTYASRVIPYGPPADLKNLIPNVIYKGPNGLGLWDGSTMQPVPSGTQ